MPQSPDVEFNDVDLTPSPDTPALGITLLIGSTRRGPVAKPDQIFTSWAAYRKVYGGYVVGNSFPIGVKRAIERGSAVRICNVKHYTSVSSGTLAGSKSTAASSAMVNLSVALVAGVTLSVIVNGTTKSQLFTTTHENTLALLCAQIETLTAVVEDCYSQFNNTIIIVPKAGVTLTVTSSATGSGAPTITVTTEATIEDSSNNTLFALVPKYIGADYDNLEVRITAASSGDTDAFNMYFDHLTEPDLSERYINLKIIGKPTALASTYLAEIVANSQFFDVTYSDLSGISGTQITPRRFAIRYQTGSDGGAIVDADYIGDSGQKNGIYSADQYSDFMHFAIPESTSVAVLQAGASYAAARKDLQFFGYLGNFTTESALATARDNTLIDTKYCQLYAQSIIVLNPLDSSDLNLSCLYDVCGAASYNDSKFRPWFSFAGKNRGLIYNSKGVTNNFVTTGNSVNLDMIAQRQVNIIGNDGGTMSILGNFTAQKIFSQYSFGNVTRFFIYFKKALGPYIKLYVEEPCDIPTWKRLYLGVQPTLNNWGAQRALHGEENKGWRWEGDQFAKSTLQADLVVNNSADVTVGKYKAKVFLKVITAMQEISLDIVLTPSGVSFEEALDITSPN